jgi:hypothetical protein
MNSSLAHKGHFGPHCVCVFVKCDEKLGELSLHPSTLDVARAEGGHKGSYNRRTLFTELLEL